MPPHFQMLMKNHHWLDAEIQRLAFDLLRSALVAFLGGEEAVRQGDGAVLLCAGETSQPVLQKEGILST